jgi:hypothetical protein
MRHLLKASGVNWIWKVLRMYVCGTHHGHKRRLIILDINIMSKPIFKHIIGHDSRAYVNLCMVSDIAESFDQSQGASIVIMNNGNNHYCQLEVEDLMNEIEKELALCR